MSGSREFRGRTFSPAEDWFDGGLPFALAKLEEVAAFLADLADEATKGRPWWCSRWRWYRRTRQREYDLQ
ncbi:MAG TPA: hypothetical protein VNM89_10160, partial [Solirubrobacterales bacterium]|nr:hypothetical protein [Solirubrobacterales bacterium]